jgi:(p)ppGpp synthase/HD superfamily hydrolase
MTFHELTSPLVKARLFANIAHSGQLDKAGQPYIGHPYRVGALLQARDWAEPVVMAGFLHDVVEDTPVTLDLIEFLFGARVARLVDLVSQRKGEETYREYIERIVSADDPAATAIKLADLEDNSRPDRLAAIEDDEERARLTAMARGRYVDARMRLLKV